MVKRLWEKVFGDAPYGDVFNAEEEREIRDIIDTPDDIFVEEERGWSGRQSDEGLFLTEEDLEDDWTVEEW